MCRVLETASLFRTTGEKTGAQLGGEISPWFRRMAGFIREGFQLLAISAEIGIRVGLLPGPHKDPFDGMLIAQAQAGYFFKSLSTKACPRGRFPNFS